MYLYIYKSIPMHAILLGGQGWYLGDGHSSKPGPSKGFQLDPKGL